MGNIAIYCRVSTGLQNTDRQRVELLALAKKRKEEIDESNVYEDIISGFSQGEERPEYSRLMQDVESGIIKEIWFHEMTRMARNSIELLAEIKRLSNIGVKLFFLKQNLLVDPNNPTDIGQKVLLSVLAVTAEYEIELFMERSVSGKIRKIQEGYGITADSHAYGYTVDDNKRMVINKAEAEIIHRIYTMYADGLSTLQIADILNSENITKNGVKWSAGMVTKVLNKELYLGHRHVVFHKPVVNKEEKKKMQEKGERPEVIYTFDVPQEDLRIIDDILFQRVKERLKQAPYNKDNTTKHYTLLTKKLRCGECGSTFTLGKNESNRTYRCYGRVNRSDKPATCNRGVEVSQLRMDGLVLQLSIRNFAQINLKTDIQDKLKAIKTDIQKIQSIIASKKKEVIEADETYKTSLRRLMRISDDSTADTLINEVKEEHDKRVSTIEKELKKYTSQIAELTVKAAALRKMTEKTNLYTKINQLWNSPIEIKSMIDELIDVIEVYRMNSTWSLVIVKYVDGGEVWGRLKTARYKNDEMFYDPMICQHGMEYESWVINNGERCFTYNKDTHTIYYNGKSKIYTAFETGEYDYESFNKMQIKTEWMGSFPPYDYEKMYRQLQS